MSNVVKGGPTRKVYRVAWGWDSNFAHLLTHEREFSADEFMKLCERAIQETWEGLLDRGKHIWLDDLMRGVEEVLCRRHGFEPLQLVDGWFSYPVMESYEALSERFPFLPEDLRRRIVKHGRTVQKLVRK